MIKYKPKIQENYTETPNLDTLAQTLCENGCTHLETGNLTYPLYLKKDGSARLNKKTVTVEDEVYNKLRHVRWEDIASFGLMEEEQQQVAPAQAGRDHALLSASGAHRWINCTPSARLEENYPDEASEAAEEGTAAHALAEHKLRFLLDQPTQRPTFDWEDEEMEDYCDQYADHVMAELARTRETSPAAFLAIEQRLDFSHIVPGGFGTGDALIVGEPTMTVIDFKYGKGVKVDAVGNEQMRLYALGALHQYGMIYNIRRIRTVIFQPRINNISVEEISVEDLRQWASQVVEPAAKMAEKGEGELSPGDWCTFCNHSPQCAGLAAQYFQIIPTEGEGEESRPVAPDPDTLTDEQVAHIVEWSGEIKKWLTKVENFALGKAASGYSYPGLKVVEGRSRRYYTDENEVAAAVEKVGKDPWEKKLLGITGMTKLLGKKQFDEVLGPLVHKPAGKPTLVPLSDARPPMVMATPETVFTPITTSNQ